MEKIGKCDYINRKQAKCWFLLLTPLVFLALEKKEVFMPNLFCCFKKILKKKERHRIKKKLKVISIFINYFIKLVEIIKIFDDYLN